MRARRATARQRHRPEWRRGWRATRELLAHPDRTEHAFAVGRALDGDRFDRDLERLLREPEGRRLYAERPVLLDALSDRAALARLPEGSFGRAYLDHVDTHGLDPGKLVALRRDTDPDHATRAPGLRWLVERIELMHDLWHVLAGYGADGAGEAALLPFSLAQRYRHAGVVLSFGAGRMLVRVYGPAWIPYAARAYWRGRRAGPLIALPYEALLPRPLDEVRRRAGLGPPERAHPAGVLVMEPTGRVVPRRGAARRSG